MTFKLWFPEKGEKLARSIKCASATTNVLLLRLGECELTTTVASISTSATVKYNRVPSKQRWEIRIPDSLVILVVNSNSPSPHFLQRLTYWKSLRFLVTHNYRALVDCPFYQDHKTHRTKSIPVPLCSCSAYVAFQLKIAQPASPFPSSSYKIYKTPQIPPLFTNWFTHSNSEPILKIEAYVTVPWV